MWADPGVTTLIGMAGGVVLGIIGGILVMRPWRRK